MAGVAACNQAGWDDQDDTDLVGREAELTALLGLVDRVAAGTGQRAVIEGEVGVGKTRLVSEVLARAGAAGLQVFAEPPPDAGSIRPGVIVVEDLHALDPAALAGVARLAAALRGQPVLLLLTARLVPRSRELTALLAGLQELGALRMALGGLEPDDVALLAQRRLGRAPSGRLRRSLTRTGGNPALVLALTDALSPEAEPAPGEASPADLPPELFRTIAHDLVGPHDLAPDVRQLLSFASILGRTFPPGDLSLLTGRPVAQLAGPLATGLASGLLVEDGDWIGFRHDLVREALYRDLPQAVRAGLHQEFGWALARAEAPPRQVADHLLRGAEPGDARAVGWLHGAAQEVAGQDPHAAIDLLERALRLAGPTHPLRSRLVSERALALVAGGDAAEAEEACRRALARREDATQEGALRLALTQLLLVQGRAAEALGEAESAIDSNGLTPREHARAQALAAWGRLLLGDLPGGELAAEQAEAAAYAAGDSIGACQAVTARARLRNIAAHFGEAAALARQGVRLAERDPRGQAPATLPHLIEGLVLMDLDRFGDAEDAFERGRQLSEQLGPRSAVPIHVFASALGNYCAGEWDDALAGVQTGLHLARGAGSLWAIPARALEYLIASHRGDAELPTDDLVFASAGPDGPEGVPLYGVEWVLIARAVLAESMGHPEAGLRALRDGWDRCVATGRISALPTLGPSLLRRSLHRPPTGTEGLRDEVVALLDDVAARSPDTARPAAAAALCRGLADQDPGRLMEAVDRFRAVPRPLERAMALEDAAVVLAKGGHGDDGRRLWNEALDLYDALDARRTIRRGTARLRRVGVRGRSVPPSPKRPKSGWEALTRTELNVVDLLAGGLTNGQIGDQMFISQHTVHTHVSHALSKLGLDSRVVLATEARRRRQ